MRISLRRPRRTGRLNLRSVETEARDFILEEQGRALWGSCDHDAEVVSPYHEVLCCPDCGAERVVATEEAS